MPSSTASMDAETWAIGDLQGCLDSLLCLLPQLPTDARLWMPGDLVNRGPRSLDSLRWAIAQGARLVTVLGNHDLHLLAVAAGIRPAHRTDTLDDILAAATASRIPLYFVRTNYNKGFNEAVPDALWKDAVERAGGRFYIARDENSLLKALADIDRESVGTVQVRHYATQQPRFSSFALVAAALWACAASLRLGWPVSSTLP